MNLITPVRVWIRNRNTRKHPDLEAHLVTEGNGEICGSSWNKSTMIVMPLGSFAEWNISCHQCARSAAKVLDLSKAFGSVEEELDSPFGRPAVQVLKDEGLVEKAAKMFGRQYPDIVSGLSQASLAKVLDVVSRDGWTQSVSLICKYCGSRHTSLADWPKTQGIIFRCPDCDGQATYTFDEYSPTLDDTEEHLERIQDASGYGNKLVDVTDYAHDVEAAVTQSAAVEHEVLVNRTEEWYIVHYPDDGVTECGLDYGTSVPVDIYETSIHVCGHCA